LATTPKRRLLIVEDEPLLRVAISDALRKEGWIVDLADNGLDGAALFQKDLHDLVSPSRRCATGRPTLSPSRSPWVN